MLLSSGRPRATSSAAVLSSSSRTLRLVLFACPGTNFFIPLLPDLVLPSSRLGLECTLFLEGDLSRLIDPIEPLARSMGLMPPSGISEERRLLEKTFLMPCSGGDIGDTTGDDCVEMEAMAASWSAALCPVLAGFQVVGRCGTRD